MIANLKRSKWLSTLKRFKWFCGIVKYPYTKTFHMISTVWSLTDLFLLYYSILWALFMWYTGMCSQNRDQSSQWRSIIVTSKWVTLLLEMPIVKSKWIMMLLGTSIVMSQWVMRLQCVHIISFIMYYLCLIVLFYYG